MSRTGSTWMNDRQKPPEEAYAEILDEFETVWPLQERISLLREALNRRSSIITTMRKAGRILTEDGEVDVQGLEQSIIWLFSLPSTSSRSRLTNGMRLLKMKADEQREKLSLRAREAELKNRELKMENSELRRRLRALEPESEEEDETPDGGAGLVGRYGVE